MNRFGFRILNHGEKEALIRYAGRGRPIPAHGSIEVDFPGWYDAAEAVNRLHDVAWLLTASFPRAFRAFDFAIVANEFGYRIYSESAGVFDVELLDPEPDKYALPGGAILTTNDTFTSG